MDVGNLISVSSAFYKSSLNIWKFMVPDWIRKLKDQLQIFVIALLLKKNPAYCSAVLYASFNFLLASEGIVKENKRGTQSIMIISDQEEEFVIRESKTFLTWQSDWWILWLILEHSWAK